MALAGIRRSGLLSQALAIACCICTLNVLGARAEPAAKSGLETRPSTSEALQFAITTTMGSFTIELYRQHAPITVANFLQLVERDFYNGLLFHRVVEGFVIQAGGFDAQYRKREADKTIQNESVMGLRNDRGTVAMARAGHPDSASSQFFINLKDNHFLNSQHTTPGYTVFAKVVSGMEVVDNIAAVKTGNLGGNFAETPVQPVLILDVRRAHDPTQR